MIPNPSCSVVSPIAWKRRGTMPVKAIARSPIGGTIAPSCLPTDWRPKSELTATHKHWGKSHGYFCRQDGAPMGRNRTSHEAREPQPCVPPPSRVAGQYLFRASLTRWPRCHRISVLKSRRSGRDYYEKDFLSHGHSLRDHYRNDDHDSHCPHGSVFRLGICEPFGKRVVKGRKVTCRFLRLGSLARGPGLFGVVHCLSEE